MRGRLAVLFCGVVFSVTLALVVGQRLSAQAMAVVIGVIAGVATSIPTSVFVVWFMGHATGSGVATIMNEAASAGPRSPEQPEPRIVVMPAPQQAQPSGFAGLAGYATQSYAGYAQPASGPVYAAPGYGAPAYSGQALPARRFTVIGGSALDGGEEADVVEEQVYLEEGVTWQR